MVHILKRKQFLPIKVQHAWEYFSNPANLEEITPAGLRFSILSPLPPAIYPGLVILYKIALFGGVKFEWMTEITHVEQFRFFVDEQRSGPYRIWHHEHHFAEVPGGVEMTDIVHYKLPLGILGNLFHTPLIKPKLEQIFNYRHHVLEHKFKVQLK